MRLTKCKFTQTERSATFEDDEGVLWTPNDPAHEPHQDLKDAMAGLASHYKNITDIASKRYEVKGATWHGFGESEGIKISGTVSTSKGEPMSLVSPIRRFSDVELYPDMDELLKDLEALTKEVHAYFYESKYADASQTSIDDVIPES